MWWGQLLSPPRDYAFSWVNLLVCLFPSLSVCWLGCLSVRGSMQKVMCAAFLNVFPLATAREWERMIRSWDRF